MSLFSKLLGRKDAPEGTVHADWPWTLNVGGQSAPMSWEELSRALDALDTGQDSFVILEQRDPKAPDHYWYIQSAIATAGDHAGQYIVGVGYSRQKGAALLERYEDAPEQVVPFFRAALNGAAPDFAQFEDHSSWLPVNQ